MRCPRCGFDGESVGGGCPRCGYGSMNMNMSSGPLRLAVQHPSSIAMPLTLHTLMRGDVLRQGRYRLIEQLSLPENQQEQGAAWLASDAQSPTRRVVIREVILPEESPAEKEQVVGLIASRLAELGQHPGFPKLIEVFEERDACYIVLQQPEGESLASMLRRQGGALPERVVAEYGRQLCEMLIILSQHRPPLVHSAISPSTIIVSPDGKRVSLIHMPIFPPKESYITRDKSPSGYLAPEQTRGIIDPASDLYGVAATLHHAVTGYDPRERMAFFHPPARRLNPTVTQRMEEILVHALRLSAPQRYAHPVDMLKDLNALIRSYPPESIRSGPTTDPLRLNVSQIRQQSRKRSSNTMAMFGVIGVFVLVLFLLATLPLWRVGTGATPAVDTALQNATATSLAQQQVALNTELALELQNFQKKGIGVSDGRLVFDTYTGRNDADLKKQAAQAMQHNDLSSAVNFLTRAVSADPTDGEAQIYNEDLHILQSGVPYVTIVLGLAVDSTVFDFLLGRTEMQGAFLAQREINSGGLLPHGLHLRLLIDNSGANAADVATAAQFIANRVAKAGNPDHIIAVVGWPFSSQSINARDIIASVHLPLVSETASSVRLSGSSPYFFRVNPPDNLQGNTLGKFAAQQLQAKNILVMRDRTDPYSVSLADAFTSSVKALNANAINKSADSFTEGTTTVTQYEKIIHDAKTLNVDTIYLEGLDVDAVRLAHAVGEDLRALPGNAFLTKLRILCGDAVDTNLLLGQGSGPDATIASKFPGDMRRLTFTAFGHPDEWTFLGYPKNQQPMFFANWVSIYQNSTVAEDNAPPPGNDAILTHDAVKVIAKAATYVPGPLTGQAV